MLRVSRNPRLPVRRRKILCLQTNCVETVKFLIYYDSHTKTFPVTKFIQFPAVAFRCIIKRLSRKETADVKLRLHRKKN